LNNRLHEVSEKSISFSQKNHARSFNILYILYLLKNPGVGGFLSWLRQLKTPHLPLFIEMLLYFSYKTFSFGVDAMNKWFSKAKVEEMVAFANQLYLET
jgi:hypothetical protein